MTSREPANPAVHRLAAAINDGDRDALTGRPGGTVADTGLGRQQAYHPVLPDSCWSIYTPAAGNLLPQ